MKGASLSIALRPRFAEFPAVAEVDTIELSLCVHRPNLVEIRTCVFYFYLLIVFVAIGLFPKITVSSYVILGAVWPLPCVTDLSPPSQTGQSAPACATNTPP